MSEHGNDADGDASVLSVLPAIPSCRAGLLELALCLGDGSVGHRQLAVHDGRKALSGVGFRSLYEAPDKTNPSGIGVTPCRDPPGESRASASPTETPQLGDTVPDPHRNP